MLAKAGFVQTFLYRIHITLIFVKDSDNQKHLWRSLSSSLVLCPLPD
ncbi:hypothetical protein LEP1GSC016_0550 [Leptospira borgpetersenii serovar Hardjo-bovis str. Sponselee]|uniref:Uncharacterized protein n=5 Tax=Leptospira borgpetersenii TaxID=174 RepID=A0A0S2ITJ8_LEPBO|nr:hypothetical protein LBBP_02768 [Leptospira borgpetersenii serovar Ballum]EKP15077.1 hypothetical protein LEP1GSC128_2274 [Leptospira borgpetersenii str. 200801926]EKQ99206.1 hypothetical protein LEP1GSC121_2656 [Leptospira borgpetersenii serovar Castellonis str. 200801910]EMJ85213.1 hypothetical protein LEP1GSC016_0550 [Leptospira borgpetersenii serovar Hardjo-bovis str. Sponselee]EMK09474.1 hypothetical protein LEP1GSC066_1980 [Leptospira sp. serovar Kenya str. Sh9]EMN12800.1 hypothetical